MILYFFIPAKFEESKMLDNGFHRYDVKGYSVVEQILTKQHTPITQ